MQNMWQKPRDNRTHIVHVRVLPMDTAQEPPRQSVVPDNKSHSLKIEVEPAKRAQSTGRSDAKWGDGVGSEAPSH